MRLLQRYRYVIGVANGTFSEQPGTFRRNSPDPALTVLASRIDHYRPLLVERLTRGGDYHRRRRAHEDSRSIGSRQMGHRLPNKPGRSRFLLTELELTAR